MRPTITAVIMLIIAAAAQGLYPAALTIHGVKPDLVLVVLIWVSIKTDPIAGSVLGFFAGLLHGSIVGMRLGTFIATRTIGGFLAGSTTASLFGQNPLVPVAAAVILTVVVETLFLLFSPVMGILDALTKILIEAAYNGVLILILSVVAAQIRLRRRIRLAQDRFWP